jgi:hypothetical protein
MKRIDKLKYQGGVYDALDFFYGQKKNNVKTRANFIGMFENAERRSQELSAEQREQKKLIVALWYKHYCVGDATYHLTRIVSQRRFVKFSFAPI